MLARKTGTVPTVTTDPADPLDALREFLASVPTGAAIQLASRNLIALREERAALAERHRSIVQEIYREGHRKALDEEMQRLEGEIAGRDPQIVAARVALREARAAWLPKLTAAVAPHRAGAGKAIVAAVESLRAEAAVLYAIDTFAARNGVELPVSISVPSLEHLLPAAHKLAEAGAK
jgi:hypothetical protein